MYVGHLKPLIVFWILKNLLKPAEMPFFQATLSNALEISKNTPQTSKPSSKDLYIPRVIERSWLVQESPPLKRD